MYARSLCVYREPIARGVGQGLFAESAMIMCTGFNCIPCMQKTALSSCCLCVHVAAVQLAVQD